MGRVGPLTPAWSYPFPRPAQIQDSIEHPVLDGSLDQTCAELAQDRAVETRIRQLQCQRIFPIDPAANRLGGLPIRQSVSELHDENQRQTPWRFRGLAASGVEIRKHPVAIDRPQFIPQIEPYVAFGKSRPGNTGGLIGDRDYLHWLQRHRSLHRLLSRYQYLGFSYVRSNRPPSWSPHGIRQQYRI
jgi:hypothetical protein